MRKCVSTPLRAKKTSREMKQNAFRFHAQASAIMTLVQYNLQSNYGFQPLNRTSLLCTGAVKKMEKKNFPKCFTLRYKLWRRVVQSSFFQNVCYLEVSAIGSTGLFVDLDQENASVWSPPPKTNLEKHRPHMASGGGDKPESPIRPPEAAPHQPHTRTCRNDISRSGGTPPHSDHTGVR